MAKLEKLLENNDLAAYWMGFLLADGHFSNYGKLSVTLSEKDADHIVRLAGYLELEPYREPKRKRISCVKGNKRIVDMIKLKFDISNRKTYFPPKINLYQTFSNSYFTSFFIGLVDGDGSITNNKNTKTNSIVIGMHLSWYDFLNMVSERMQKISQIKITKPFITSSKIATLAITNHRFNKFAKFEVKRLGLPVLERKWSRIDENHFTPNELYKVRRDEIIKMLKQKSPYSVIAEKFGTTCDSISKVAQKYGLTARRQTIKRQFLVDIQSNV